MPLMIAKSVKCLIKIFSHKHLANYDSNVSNNVSMFTKSEKTFVQTGSYFLFRLLDCVATNANAF